MLSLGGKKARNKKKITKLTQNRVKNIRPKSIKLLGENINRYSLISFLVMIFFWGGEGWHQKQRQQKPTRQTGMHQIKQLLAAKETINKIKRQSTEWK